MAPIPAGSRPGEPPKKSKPATKPAGRKTPAGKAAPKRVAKKVVARRKAANIEPASLSEQALRFVDEFLVDLNGKQAAIRAGYSAKTAASQASRLLTNVNVQAAIAAGREAQQQRTQITADALLTQAWAIAHADARELIETRVGCCRHCWGEGFRYQRTVSEMNYDKETWRKEDKPLEDFDEQGGIGYNPHLRPHPQCTACVGDGQAREVIKDTRYLSPAAAQLYAGVKRTKDGLQVLMHSKEAYAEKLWKYLGLYERDNEQKIDPLAAILGRIASGSSNGFVPVAEDPERGSKPQSLPVVADPPPDDEGD